MTWLLLVVNLCGSSHIFSDSVFSSIDGPTKCHRAIVKCVEDRPASITKEEAAEACIIKKIKGELRS